MATTAAHTTARLDGDTLAVRLARMVRELFPFREVVLPWLLARLLVVPALVATAEPGRLQMGKLIWMDGQWFRLIALDWYNQDYVDGLWSEYPFFPLLPAIGGGLMKLGLPPAAALAGTAWVGALVAGAGVLRLARRHLPERAARWAPWFVAIAPGGVSLVLGYGDSVFLAGAVWAFVFVEDRRWWPAGVAALVATASRPNGVIAAVGVAVVVVVARAGWRAVAQVVVPSAVFLVIWMWFLDSVTGDPLVFWHAKDAWDEVTLPTALADPGSHHLSLFHLGALAALALPYAWRARGQPIAWAVVAALVLLPPLYLGVDGLARYAVLAFPLPIATADVVSARGTRWVATYLVLAATAMVFLGRQVSVESWVP
jgi:hypothetical protein